MHPNEVPTGVDLVRLLLADQFPRWADLPVTAVTSSGTDNAMFRLGADLAVRLPRIPGAAGNIAREREWMPRLAPHLPVPIPLPVAEGRPGRGYPFPWSVCRWVDGVNPGEGADPVGLAAFVRALRRIEPSGPASFRGQPLVSRDTPTREAIAALDGMVDTVAVTEAWEAALAVPAWSGPPVWVHGDLSPGNLVVRDGALTGVLDFSGVGVGDPAVDLMPAWNLMPASARAAFRRATGVDDATWLRGRGWALSVAVIQLPYYKDTNPVLAANARRVIREVLASRRRPGSP
ncbi:aminoglycoside phosphotransferase family protein [Actinokineospora sp. UTMC 2448]|uniref:aminoglycoside phosphotransferase family protein n=1 Tax=Actinokineospora sp. UTMC 2448 TaxID=2268449 RepID=UPI0021642AA6|nr:aminoglycoside phosphotransferase family protein [Actinokineospora sp. UTMC 2448]UVS79762.1 Aminoglycoside phosphotransferase [Actinokineospora sp. UTMC 2448]